jgi:hypothetical protein
VVRGQPIDDLLLDRRAAVDAVGDGADSATARGVPLADVVDAHAPLHPVRRVGHRCPDLVRRRADVCLEEQAHVLARHDITRGRLLCLPARPQVDQSAAHLADVLIALHVGNEAGKSQRVRACIGYQRVAAQPVRLGDRVLEQPMGHDHVGPDQLAAPSDIVLDERAVVGTELEIELWRAPAGVARAARSQRHRATAAGKREVCRLERPQQSDAVDRLALWRDAEHGVALKLGQSQRRAQPIGDHPQQVSENVVGMLELYAREVSRVATDVGEHEATLS